MLFTIQSIKSYFSHYFKLQKIEFKQLIDDIVIDFLSFLNFVSIEIYENNIIWRQIYQNFHLIKKY